MALLDAPRTRRPGRLSYALGATLTLIFAGLAAGACEAPRSVDPAGGSPLGTPPPHIAACLPACSTASDCVPPQGPALYDASHFTCTAGVCEWTGCNTTDECTTAYQGAKLACSRPAGAAHSACVPACSTAADCVSGKSDALNDAEHYTCTAGVCQWTGCRNTGECTSAYPGAKLACQKPADSPIAACVPTCATAADCAEGSTAALYDAGHFACTSGLCQWTGCKSTTECTTAYPGAKVVCK
jgi:hypothetical protein